MAPLSSQLLSQPRRAAACLAVPLLAAACAALTPPAAAQVLRCTDAATGRVTYTDGDCPQGAAQQQVQRRQSADEIGRERAQAAEALTRRLERQQQEAALQALRAPLEAASPARAPDPAASPDCQRARQALQQALAEASRGLYEDQMRASAAREQADLACLSPAEYARSRRNSSSPAWPPAAVAPVIVVPPPHAHPVRPPPVRPREITHCNVFRCYDRQGNVYPR